MNKIILLGRLTKNPEIRIGQNGSKVGRFTLAVPRKFVKEGEERQTDFFNAVTFGKQAEFLTKYFSKGQQVAIIGRAELNQYEDENGNSKISLQIVCEELHFADSKKEPNENSSAEDFNGLYENIVETSNSIDDLPF